MGVGFWRVLVLGYSCVSISGREQAGLWHQPESYQMGRTGLSLSALGWKFREIHVRGPVWRKDDALAACEPRRLGPAAVGV